MLATLKSLWYNQQEKAAISEMLWDIKTSIALAIENPEAIQMCVRLDETFYNSLEKKHVHKIVLVGYKLRFLNYVFENASERTNLGTNEILARWMPYHTNLPSKE